MDKIIPLVLVVLGLGIGLGAGFMLRPAAVEASVEDGDNAAASATEHDYVKLNNQFVIPVVEAGRVASLVVLSLSLETAVGGQEAVYAKEPKLRDSFLQVLFDHANTGGFRGSFTDSDNLIVLRRSLLEAGQRVLGSMLSDVLIIDIMRQDA